MYYRTRNNAINGLSGFFFCWIKDGYLFGHEDICGIDELDVAAPPQIELTRLFAAQAERKKAIVRQEPDRAGYAPSANAVPVRVLE